MTEKGFEVIRELRLLYGGTFRRPNIMAWKGGNCYILDVHVVVDRFALRMAHTSKCCKFDQPEI